MINYNKVKEILKQMQTEYTAEHEVYTAEYEVALLINERTSLLSREVTPGIVDEIQAAIMDNRYFDKGLCKDVAKAIAPYEEIYERYYEVANKLTRSKGQIDTKEKLFNVMKQLDWNVIEDENTISISFPGLDYSFEVDQSDDVEEIINEIHQKAENYDVNQQIIDWVFDGETHIYGSLQDAENIEKRLNELSFCCKTGFIEKIKGEYFSNTIVVRYAPDNSSVILDVDDKTIFEYDENNQLVYSEDLDGHSDLFVQLQKFDNKDQAPEKDPEPEKE